MTGSKSLFDFPIHLGLGAKAVSEPEFTGPEGYDGYMERHAGDLDEGRIVAMYRFEEPWTSWEVHPAGDEVVCCIQGPIADHPGVPDGHKPTARSSRCSSRPEKAPKIGHAELVSSPTRPSRYCC